MSAAGAQHLVASAARNDAIAVEKILKQKPDLVNIKIRRILEIVINNLAFACTRPGTIRSISIASYANTGPIVISENGRLS